MKLIWFRNDLRIDDNPALQAAVASGCACQAIFISTPKQWQEHGLAAIKIDFIERHLNALKIKLADLSISLTHLKATDFDDQAKKLVSYCQHYDIDEIYLNRENEINEQKRDQWVKKQGILVNEFVADVIVPQSEVTNQKREMYKVFTPFRQQWLKQLKQHYQKLPPRYPLGTKDYQLPLIVFDAVKKDSSKWPLADEIMDRVLPCFLSNKINYYHDDRDFFAKKATSGLSPYLAIGAISSYRVLDLLLTYYPDLLDQPKHSAFSWLNELIWREFYRHLLYSYPKLSKGANFNSKYDRLIWDNDPNYIQAWQQGKTGYPIIDAAIKQLIQTGWMHNRLRMVVASFLTKHLLVDWRVGERFFMNHLIDGDLAANNGGWQWAASTGCDAQPYFRIFNPIRQSERFDPETQFICRYLPELKEVPLKERHFPHAYIKKHQLDIYTPAIVDHKAARQQAIHFYNI